MLPKIEKGNAVMYKMDKASSTLIVEDHLKGMIKKASNTNYQPWRSYLVPKYPNSPFGDFPNGYLSSSSSKADIRRMPNYEETHAGAISLSKSLPYGTGTGGRSSSLLSKKSEFKPTKTISGAFLPRKIPKSEFRRYYERGDIPVRVEGGSKIVWRGVQPENLDYHHFLPIFFDGLREKKDPYRVLALNGTLDLIDRGGSKILPVIPQLIIPIKTNLYTRDKEIIALTLKAIQKMVISDEMIGQALVPYYRQILPIFNLYINDDLNIGDNIDYRQRKCVTLGTLIHQTLELLEVHGGEDAYINIKYLIPTYESCVIN